MSNDWRDIPGYNGMYQISRMGEVRSWRKYNGERRDTPVPVSAHKSSAKKRARHVHLRAPDGSIKKASVLGLMAKVWLGGAPPGMVPYHKNRDSGDSCLNNIGFLTKTQLGKFTGGRDNRKPVAKIDRDGNVVEIYPSITAAAKANFMSFSSVSQRCHKLIDDPYRIDGFNYVFDE